MTEPMFELSKFDMTDTLSPLIVSLLELAIYFFNTCNPLRPLRLCNLMMGVLPTVVVDAFYQLYLCGHYTPINSIVKYLHCLYLALIDISHTCAMVTITNYALPYATIFFYILVIFLHQLYNLMYQNLSFITLSYFPVDSSNIIIQLQPAVCKLCQNTKVDQRSSKKKKSNETLLVLIGPETIMAVDL